MKYIFLLIPFLLFGQEFPEFPKFANFKTQDASSIYTSFDTTGCIGWYRADQEITMGVGDSVSVWGDLSSVGNDFLVVADSCKPIYNALDATVNKPYLQFNGTSNWMYCTKPDTIRMIFIVMKTEVLETNDTYWCVAYTPTSPTPSTLMYYVAGNDLGAWFQHFERSTTVDTYTSTDWHYFGTYGKTDTSLIYIDATRRAMGGLASSLASSATYMQLMCRNRGNNTTPLYMPQVRLAEFIVFKVLDATIRDEVHAYLATRYGL